MPRDRKVRPQECVSSIAAELGYHPDTIWYDPGNSDLRSRRSDSRVLREGDIVSIPDKRTRQEAAATEARHQFRRRGVPEILHLAILDQHGEPRPNVPYRLTVGNEVFEGVTDSAGELRVAVAPSETRAKVFIQGSPATDERDWEPDVDYDLFIGALDPTDEDSGLLMRLENLGYEVGKAVAQDRLSEELARFQRDMSLEVSGSWDSATRQKVKDVYGC
jgi:hypothetical protein